MIDRRQALIGSLALDLASAARGQTPPPRIGTGAPVAGLPEPDEAIDLWPKGAPGASSRNRSIHASRSPVPPAH